EYDLWRMRMEQYLTFTDHALWEVIVNGDSVISVASASVGAKGPIPPKTAEQKLARKNKLKAKSTLTLAIPDEHLLKFHEDVNLKLLTSLPSAWNNISLIMRNKSDLDTLGMDDLYNNLKVYESEIKGQTSSSSNSQNVAFVSFDNFSSTNEIINTTHSVSTASSKDQASIASYADDVMFFFFDNQSNALKLDNEDLEQIDDDDLEEMNLKWQVAMLTMRVKRFIKKTGRNLDLNGKETIGFDRIKVECYNYHRRGHFARECRAPRNQGNRNRDDPRRNAPVDTSTTCSRWDSVINSRESDVDDNPVNDRFKTSEGFHVVPPPYTRNYMPPRLDLSFVGLDESVFKTAVKKTTTSMPEIETSISKTIATKSRQVPVNDAKQSSIRATTLINIARPVNTAALKPKVNDALPTTYSYFKAHSPVRRTFNQKSAAKTNNFNKEVNTARVNNVTTAGPKAVVSDAKGNGENAIKSSACWIWRPT
ncbi:putative ribonuclease H-like domain-containing protein, partial [Tanacetum coccineum]